jgi:hypothetical protein
METSNRNNHLEEGIKKICRRIWFTNITEENEEDGEHLERWC